MADRDDERFRPRPAKPGRGKGGDRFTRQVLRAAQKSSGGVTPLGRRSGRGAEMGRGRVAARLAGDGLGRGSRRVVVKARLVVLAKASPGSAAAHLRYIQRDGVTPQGEPGQAYGPHADRVDVEAFAARGAGDRHQFRFIVSAEDAGERGDLKAFTRDLMGRMEADLGTRLDWVAVDHHDTDNPHTHLILRGVDDQGADLVIARDYISHGLRLRACALATELLGPQTEVEIAARMARETAAERWTGLDGQLVARAADHIVNLTDAETSLAIRARSLQRLGLAQVEGPLRWRLREDLEPTLRTMGERGDIVRTMQRAFSGEPRGFEVLHEGGSAARVVGRVIASGLADEMGESRYLVLDGVDGKGHYVVLPPGMDLAEFRVGAIVAAATVSPRPRASDRTIAAVAEDGLYQPSRHLEIAKASARAGQDPEAFVGAHVRRLEALRRGGVVERLDAERWRVPADFLQRARAYEAGRFGGVQVEALGDGPPSRQARLLGVTWLDQAIVDGVQPAATGFGAETGQALNVRRLYLQELGLLTEGGGAHPRLLAELRGGELAKVGEDIQARTGLAYRPTASAGQGYRQTLSLVSGRFAMMSDGKAFSLVPWRPGIERELGLSKSQGPSI